MRPDRGVQTDEGYELEQHRRNRPWTTADYERLRAAVIALVRTRHLIPGPGKQMHTCVDARAIWSVLGALDRTD